MAFLPYSPINNGVTPAYSFYNLINLTTTNQSATLVFPGTFVPSTNYFSAYTIIIQTGSFQGIINLPDTNLGAPGNAATFSNKSNANIKIKSFEGNEIVTLAPGTVWQVVLTNNNIWTTLQMGSTTSAANASELAGAGLKALDSKLNLNMLVVTKSSTFTLDETYLSQIINWVGGSSSIALPSISSVYDGFFFFIKNTSYVDNGLISIIPTSPNLIDNGASLSVSKNQSCMIYTDGTNWFTEGLGFNNTNLGATITSQGIEVISGSSISPPYYFSSATNTGFFLNSPNIEVSINGTNTLEFNGNGVNAVSGNVNSIQLAGEPYPYIKDLLGV